MVNSPRFLLLCEAGPRAWLLDQDLRHVGEVIEEDGFIVDSLLRSATVCPVPEAETLAALGAAASLASQPLRCYELRLH